MAKNDSLSLMTSGDIKKLILGYAGPIFVGQLFQQLYNTADAMIVGNFSGQTSLAAITSIGSLSNLFVGFFTGFSTGASVIIAREIGANNAKKTSNAIHTTVALGIVLSILMTFSGYFFSPALLTMMGTPSDVYPLSLIYLRIYFLGSFPLIMYNMLVGILRAGGDSRHPLYYLIVSSLLNVVLDIVFVGGFKMDVSGAAIATVLSECVSMLLCFVQLIREEGMLHVSFKKIRFFKEDLLEIFEYGLPTGIQICVIDIANIMIQSYINSFGSIAVAGVGAYSKIDGFAFLPVTSFSMALTTFISQNKGAHQTARVKEGIKFGLFVSLVIVELIGVLVFVFSPNLIAMFNQNPEVIKYGVDRARTVSLFYCLLGFSHVVSAILRGYGKPVMPVVVMLVCWCAVRVITLMTIGTYVHNLYLTHWLYPITWFLSSTVYLFWLLKEKLI